MGGSITPCLFNFPPFQQPSDCIFESQNKCRGNGIVGFYWQIGAKANQRGCVSQQNLGDSFWNPHRLPYKKEFKQSWILYQYEHYTNIFIMIWKNNDQARYYTRPRQCLGAYLPGDLDYGWLSQPPYSPDLVPSDFFMFSNSEIWVSGERSSSKDEIMDAWKESRNWRNIKRGVWGSNETTLRYIRIFFREKIHEIILFKIKVFHLTLKG